MEHYYDKCLTIFPIVLLLVSCVRDTFMDAKEDPIVVVYCVLSDDPVQTLHLTYTKGASASEAPELTEADALLFDLTEGVLVGQFEKGVNNTWKLSNSVSPGHAYRLEVKIPGKELIWAEQTIPNEPDVSVSQDAWRGALFDTYQNVHGYVFSISCLENPLWFYGINYPQLESEGELTPLLCTDSPRVDSFNSTKSYYSLEHEHSFWGSDWFRTTSYPDLKMIPMHKKYLRFPAEEKAEEAVFLVSGTFRGFISSTRDFVHAERRPAELHFFSASKDYDRFLLDSYHYAEVQSSHNYVEIFLRDNVYTNIHGAIGILGAKIETSLEWEGNEFWGERGIFLLPGFGPVMQSSDMENGYIKMRETMEHLMEHPFELFHYEVKKGFSLPEWAPDNRLPQNSGLYDGRASFVIQDKAGLEACGLDYREPIDFTQKVILLYTRMTSVVHLPVLIGYASMGVERYDEMPPFNPSNPFGNVEPQKSQYNQYTPFVHYMVDNYMGTGAINNVTVSRIAILVDKPLEEKAVFALSWQESKQNPKGEHLSLLNQVVRDILTE